MMMQGGGFGGGPGAQGIMMQGGGFAGHVFAEVRRSVQIEMEGGQRLSGRLDLRPIIVDGDLGQYSIAPDKIKMIRFLKPANEESRGRRWEGLAATARWSSPWGSRIKLWRCARYAGGEEALGEWPTGIPRRAKLTRREGDHNDG